MTKSALNTFTSTTPLFDGMILVDADGYEFKITGMDSRMAIVSTLDTDKYVMSVIHSFIRLRYKYWRKVD